MTLSDGAWGERRRVSDCFYASTLNRIPQGYSDGRLNLRIWEKKNVISISIKWRIWDLEKSMSTIQYLPSWSRWLLLMCTLSIISRGSYEQNWNGLTWRLPTHLALQEASQDQVSLISTCIIHYSIPSISRVEAEAQAARFRWFNPSLTDCRLL